jgi:hypothetical protein
MRITIGPYILYTVLYGFTLNSHKQIASVLKQIAFSASNPKAGGEIFFSYKVYRKGFTV